MHAGWVALLSQLTDVGGLCKDKFIGAYIIMYSCVVIYIPLYLFICKSYLCSKPFSFLIRQVPMRQFSLK